MALTCMECGVGRHLLCQGTRERRGRLEPCSCDCRARITDAERAEAHKRELFKKLRRSNALLREALEVHLPAACDTVSVRMALDARSCFWEAPPWPWAASSFVVVTSQVLPPPKVGWAC
jgi:hypothetical protein